MLSAEMVNRLQEWRRKAADGSITLEEMKEAIVALRGSRKSASESAATSASRAKATKAKPDADSLLGELGL